MKANEFVKEFGLDAVREIIKGETLSWYIPQVNIQLEPHEVDFSYSDLKELVDAYELVGNFGGLKRAKRILKKAYTSFNTMISVVWNDKSFQCTIQKLEQAIAGVESCQ